MMKHNVILAALAALLCSCAAPFIERAQDPPGVSYCLGAGSNTDVDWIQLGSDNPPYGAWNVSAVGAVRWTMSKASSVSVQADYSQTLPVFDPEYWIQDRPTVDACLGYKHALGPSDALKGEIGVGWTTETRTGVYPVLSIAYLRDFGNHFTGRARLGTDLLALDVNCHAVVSDFALWFVNLGVRELPFSPTLWIPPHYMLPGITLGFGLEFGHENERNERDENQD